MGRRRDNSRVEEIRKVLEADPYIDLKGTPKKERIQVLVEPHIVDSINDYLDDNVELLKKENRGSRNKLLSGIINDWYEENLLNRKKEVSC